MPQAEFRFYAELNDFLAPERRMRAFSFEFSRNASVKDCIEALGVPHTEVDLVLADGVSVDFAYRPRTGQRISVYPVFESIDITPLLRLRSQVLRWPRFVLDANLGRLAAYLRLLGFDSLYRSDYDDHEVAEISRRQQRILLTRDQGVLKRSLVTHGYYPRSSKPREQLREVLQRFDLYRAARPFSRCTRCNAALNAVSKDSIMEQLPPLTRKYYEEFWQCNGCGQVYWKGAHYQHMFTLLREMKIDFQESDGYRFPEKNLEI